jgi:hypothetical protein
MAATPEKLPPYYVLTPVTPSADVDSRLGVGDAAIRIDVRVTAVAGTPPGALDLLLRARAIFAPAFEPSFPTVTGRRVELNWLRFESDYVDTSVVIPTTNRNPALAVDTYSLDSQPTS